MIHRGFLLRPATVLRTLVKADALRRPERFAKLLLTCESDFRGRLHWHDRPYPQRAFWQQALVVARAVPVKPLVELGLQGEQLAKRLFEQRVQEITTLRTHFDASESAY
jgi:tRNA nucleotidyltransferase (CCA-adding enzyme)